MQDCYIVSPGVNRDGHERGFIQFIFRELRLHPLHVVRDDWADVQAVCEEEGDGEGGVGTVFRIGPGCPLAGCQGEVLNFYAINRLALGRPAVNFCR